MITEGIKIGDRVKYIGLSVQVAQPGELGVVVGTPDVNRSGANVEVAWDLGATSFCWPAELEIVADGEPDHAIGLHAAQRRTRRAEAALIERLDDEPAIPAPPKMLHPFEEMPGHPRTCWVCGGARKNHEAPSPAPAIEDVYPDFDSYRRVVEDIAAMEARS